MCPLLNDKPEEGALCKVVISTNVNVGHGSDVVDSIQETSGCICDWLMSKTVNLRLVPYSTLCNAHNCHWYPLVLTLIILAKFQLGTRQSCLLCTKMKHNYPPTKGRTERKKYCVALGQERESGLSSI